MRAKIQAATDEANKAVSQSEAIKKFTILGEDFIEVGGAADPHAEAAPPHHHGTVRGSDPPCTTTAPAASTLSGPGEGGGEPTDGDGCTAGR